MTRVKGRRTSNKTLAVGTALTLALLPAIGMFFWLWLLVRLWRSPDNKSRLISNRLLILGPVSIVTLSLVMIGDYGSAGLLVAIFLGLIFAIFLPISIVRLYQIPDIDPGVPV
jgi:hypothetical protein